MNKIKKHFTLTLLVIFTLVSSVSAATYWYDGVYQYPENRYDTSDWTNSDWYDYYDRYGNWDNAWEAWEDCYECQVAHFGYASTSRPLILTNHGYYNNYYGPRGYASYRPTYRGYNSGYSYRYSDGYSRDVLFHPVTQEYTGWNRYY